MPYIHRDPAASAAVPFSVVVAVPVKRLAHCTALALVCLSYDKDVMAIEKSACYAVLPQLPPLSPRVETEE